METLLLLMFVCSGIVSSTVRHNGTMTGTVGQDITLKESVLDLGFLVFERTIIAMVQNRKMTVLEKTYEQRIVWSSETGFFTIKDLQKNDSGFYKIDSKGPGSSGHLEIVLRVYDPPPPPFIRRSNSSSGSCSLLCLVNQSLPDVSVLWFKDQQVFINHSSSHSLPLDLNEEDSGSTFTCAAQTPAERKTMKLEVGTWCGFNNNHGNINNKQRNHINLWLIVPILCVLCVVLSVYLMRRWLNKE